MARRARRPGQRLLTRAQVERAILFDYECSEDRPPTLLGFRIEGHTRAGIVEEGFHTCAERWRARHTFAGEHRALARRLVERAEAEGRLLVSWSTFDHAHMTKALARSPRLRALLDERFRNAIYTAKRWRRERHPDQSESNTLAWYADAVRYRIPERFGPGVVGEGLRRIRSQLEQGRDYPELTPAARGGWQRIVRHNAYDLEAMESVLLKTTG